MATARVAPERWETPMAPPTAFRGAVFDVDGVLVDSPHELAWREAFRALMEGEWRDIRDQTSWTAERFSPAVYQEVMAGRPRMEGARAAMEYFGVPDIDSRIDQYADAKQEHVIKLIDEGRVVVEERQALPGTDPPGPVRRGAADRVRLRPRGHDARRGVRCRHLRPRLPPGQAPSGDLPD